MFKKKPRKEDGMDLLMRAMLAGSPSDAILSQESDGQQSFVASETLPTDMRSNAKAVLKAAGVKFLGVVEDDPHVPVCGTPRRLEEGCYRSLDVV